LRAATLFLKLSVDAAATAAAFVVVVVVVLVAAAVNVPHSLFLFWLESGAETLTQCIDMATATATVSFHLFFFFFSTRA